MDSDTLRKKIVSFAMNDEWNRIVVYRDEVWLNDVIRLRAYESTSSTFERLDCLVDADLYHAIMESASMDQDLYAMLLRLGLGIRAALMASLNGRI